MPKLRLSFISAFNERVEPLMKGSVQAEGIELVPTYSHPSETFWRQLKYQEFEVGEMSMSSYLIARERGFDMIALPVFPSRRLFHTESHIIWTQTLRNPKISSANGSVSVSISKPPRSGSAVFWNTISACRSTKCTGLWNGPKS